MEPELPTLSEPPWYFRLAARRLRSGRRGGNFLLRNFRRAGLLDKCVRVPIGGGETVVVPLYWMGTWYEESLEGYERAAVAAFAAAIEAAGGPTVLVDCGADVGIYSRVLLARVRDVKKVIAFEPNDRSCAMLRRNLAESSVPSEVHCAGVLDAPGFGTLHGERYKSHGNFVERADSGGIRLCTVDGLDLPADHVLALKVDVEGGELAVLRGSAKSLAKARKFAVQFEAHPDVSTRTGGDPIECVRLLASIRPCRWLVAERPDVALSADRPFFEQVPRGTVYNVIASSIG